MKIRDIDGYALRTTAGPHASKESPAYLASVRDGGNRTHWGPREHARLFTRAQREAFKMKYPHVKGRWILVKAAWREVTR